MINVKSCRYHSISTQSSQAAQTGFLDFPDCRDQNQIEPESSAPDARIQTTHIV